jgi:hypothetical protein
MDQDRRFSNAIIAERRDSLTTQGCIRKMMTLFVDEVAIWIITAQGPVMNHQVPKYAIRVIASLMLGIPEAKLNRISKQDWAT